jgi:hypothetical protein
MYFMEFSQLHIVHTDIEAHSASYAMGTNGFFSRGKAVGT